MKRKLKKQAKICCFANQKGGVGKSTLTSLIANYLHLKTNYRVCVIDADNNQRTLEEVRKRDIELLGMDESILYDLLSVDSNNVPSVIEEMLSYPDEDQYDYIFIDLPGNILQKGVFQTYFFVEFCFLPTDVTFADISSLSKFIDIYNKEVVEKRKSLGLDTYLYGVLSKINPKQIEVREFVNNIKTQPIKFMSNYIPHTVALKREITTGSEHQSQTFDFELFCKEFIKLTQVPKK